MTPMSVEYFKRKLRQNTLKVAQSFTLLLLSSNHFYSKSQVYLNKNPLGESGIWNFRKIMTAYVNWILLFAWHFTYTYMFHLLILTMVWNTFIIPQFTREELRLSELSVHSLLKTEGWWNQSLSCAK